MYLLWSLYSPFFHLHVSFSLFPVSLIFSTITLLTLTVLYFYHYIIRCSGKSNEDAICLYNFYLFWFIMKLPESWWGRNLKYFKNLLVSWVLKTEEILSHAFIMKKNYSCMYRSHRCNKFCLVSNILIKKNTFLKCDQNIPTCWYIINCGLSRESIFKSIIILLYDHRRIYTDISHWVLSNKDFN